MLKVIFAILLSFVFTFLITVPFIGFLFKFNIRRLSEKNLANLLPDRELKLGTPIMGGLVIIISLLLFSFIFLREWDYFMAIVFISLLGSIFGGIDEYVNTLGKTFFAVRVTKSSKIRNFSLFPASGLLKYLKSILLIPWKLFEEILRVSGSEQKGLKNHYKFAMYFLLIIIPFFSLVKLSHQTYTFLPLLGYIDIGIFYYFLIAFLLIFFGVAFGITDGLDGLSAGLHSFTFLAIATLAHFLGYSEIALVSAIIFGSELAFLYFNVKPARLQMSDVGTLPLGMLMVFLVALMHKEIVLLFIGVIYVCEILSSLLQQWSVKVFKRRVFLVAPIHHHFEKLGWEESKVVERFWLVGALFSFVGIFIALL